MANKKTPEIIPDSNAIKGIVEEYQALKAQEKVISERKKLLADAIKAYATQNGTKDSNGSFYSENESFIFGSQCKKSVSFDEPKALAFLQAEGYSECIDVKPVINEDKVEARVNCGDITPEQLESITKIKTTFAVDVRKKEEAVTIQQTTATVAAQKKKPTLRRK